MLKGKKILLGITGSIAAYKSAFLLRLLIKEGAEVKVVLTPSAKEFVTPLTLSTLSKNPVYSDFVANPETGEWTNHVELGLWADVFLIAPATANTLAKMENGTADNLLLATYLSARCPVLFAPAMDLDMHGHQSTQQNITTLQERENVLIPAEKGELASGLEGEGRMAEPEHIVELLQNHFAKDLPLKGKHILVTAGPTYEPIDPVRFIGNHSTGKMGFAIAEEAASLGATVTLVTGTTNLTAESSLINRVDVVTAEEMYQTSVKAFEKADVAILSAAVADFRPKNVSKEKIKKGENQTPEIELEPTQDILKTLGEKKKANQLLVGFALETENAKENAYKKVTAKNLDFIVLNSLKEEGAGFGGDTNKVYFIDKTNNVQEFGLKPKLDVAKDILQKIIESLSVQY